VDTLTIIGRALPGLVVVEHDEPRVRPVRGRRDRRSTESPAAEVTAHRARASYPVMDEREHEREVYAVSAGRLVAQLYALTGDFGEAQDVVHEAFAKALVRHGGLTRVDNPEAWLRTVAVNLARSRHRRRVVFERLVRTGRVDRPQAATTVAASTGWSTATRAPYRSPAGTPNRRRQHL
jgi:DNA-directed RNA polymerase specialized sigma24 family protein